MIFFFKEQKEKSINEGDIDVLKYYCLRCGSEEIIEFDKSFECTLCTDKDGLVLEFDKEDFDTYTDKSKILSVQEKLVILRGRDL